MPIENLKKMLARVHAELEDTTGLAENEEESLRALLDDIEERLDELDEERDGAAKPEDLGERVNAAMGEFQAGHPNLAFTLRRLVDTLQKMGI